MANRKNEETFFSFFVFFGGKHLKKKKQVMKKGEMKDRKLFLNNEDKITEKRDLQNLFFQERE